MEHKKRTMSRMEAICHHTSKVTQNENPISVSFFPLISPTPILQPHLQLYHVCPQHPSLCATHDEETHIYSKTH